MWMWRNVSVLITEDHWDSVITVSSSSFLFSSESVPFLILFIFLFSSIFNLDLNCHTIFFLVATLFYLWEIYHVHLYYSVLCHSLDVCVALFFILYVHLLMFSTSLLLKGMVFSLLFVSIISLQQFFVWFSSLPSPMLISF